ncbi:Replication factor A protein 2 [Leucoagaricus sp. SymC.cos]|nr:Replication factor A protein 2 [Leucoagaricus sp. SymC.cos]
MFVKTEQAHADAPWMLDGFEIGHVSLVGQIVSMQAQTTNHVYTIEDGYGSVEARHWVGGSGNAAAEAAKWSGIEAGIYVRLSGFLKSFGNKKYINASYMRPIVDFDEIAFHYAECVTVTLTLQRGPPYNPGAGQQKAVSGSGSSAYQLNNAMDTRDEYSNLPIMQQQIVRFLIQEQDASRNGVHVGDIARHLEKSGSVNAEKLSGELDELMDHGDVYNTVDDNHFALSR